MPETVSSIYTTHILGDIPIGGNLPNSNIKLRFGEVKREILPTDKESYSKLYREYEVLVQHYEGGSATHRMYHHCMVLNSLCGLADHSDTALRISDKQDFNLGNGSRVFILCVEGNDARAIIIGGPQQRKDISTGVHKELEFNGVNFQVFEDGSWSITNKGKTDNLGNLDKKADQDGAGTTVKVEANGNFKVSTPNDKCSVLVNHKEGSIVIDSSSSVTVKTKEANIEADTVNINSSVTNLNSTSTNVGSNASQSAVLGESLVEVLSLAFSIIAPTLPTPPQQAALSAASGALVSVLSPSVKVA